MKIRTDFVTNSSSSSFILDTFNGEKLDFNGSCDVLKQICINIMTMKEELDELLSKQNKDLYNKIEYIRNVHKDSIVYKKEIEKYYTVRDEVESLVRNDTKYKNCRNAIIEKANAEWGYSKDIEWAFDYFYEDQSRIDIVNDIAKGNKCEYMVNLGDIEDIKEHNSDAIGAIDWYNDFFPGLWKSILDVNIMKGELLLDQSVYQYYLDHKLYEKFTTYDDYLEAVINGKYISILINNEAAQSINKQISKYFNCGALLNDYELYPEILAKILLKLFKYSCNHMG